MTATQYRFTFTRNLNRLTAVALLLMCLSANVPVAHSHRNSTTPMTPWEVKDLSPRVLQLALQAVKTAATKGLGNQKIVGIIDFSLPSTKRRFWVLDLEHKRVLFHELVAHGKGSGENFATSFSNQPGSSQSSLGLYLTQSPYEGEHGYSLRLHGLEPGVNDQARARAIVLHGAWYVSQSMIAQQQRLGRSLGCPAVENSVVKPLVDTLKDGHLLFAYYPDSQWLSTSQFLHPVNP
jgi:hypothetical protein